MKVETIINALLRLQQKLIKDVKDEYPDERYPEDLDDRVGEISNTIEILEDLEYNKI